MYSFSLIWYLIGTVLLVISTTYEVKLLYPSLCFQAVNLTLNVIFFIRSYCCDEFGQDQVLQKSLFRIKFIVHMGNSMLIVLLMVDLIAQWKRYLIVWFSWIFVNSIINLLILRDYKEYNKQKIEFE